MAILMIGNALSETGKFDDFVSPYEKLKEAGREQARILGCKLITEYGVDITETRVATSQTTQSQETAIMAGFCSQRHYSQLGYIGHSLSYDELKHAIDSGDPPPAAIRAVENLLYNPPSEQIWITDILLMGMVCRELNVYSGHDFIPDFCEIREFPL